MLYGTLSVRLHSRVKKVLGTQQHKESSLMVLVPVHKICTIKYRFMFQNPFCDTHLTEYQDKKKAYQIYYNYACNFLN